MTSQSEQPRTLLRHSLATLAYRAEKVLRQAPGSFATFDAGGGTRTPGQILAHMGDLMDWAHWLFRGEHRWRDSTPLRWEEEVERFFRTVRQFDDDLASDQPAATSLEQLFQGPVADALAHTGQLAMLRRMAGAPVRGENYFKAEIVPGRVGQEQSGRRLEFD
jgi:hypothetical protein